MGAVYKSKNGSSCKMCKPHKNGWAKKKTNKQLAIENMHKQEMNNEF